MSCPVNLQALPAGAFEAVFTPENVRERSSMKAGGQLSFPKSRSALWDSTPTGGELRLQLGSHRKPRLLLLHKALRLAQRHVRHSNKLRLHGFFLGTLSVDADEEGVTVTLDRFDPGRDQAGAPGRVPSALLPGDVLVPCLFSTQAETASDTVVQSEAEFHHCFKVLQQCVSGRQALDVSQLLSVGGRVVCSQRCDAAAFSLRWSSVCPAVGVDVQPVRAVPIIPTALLRSLTAASRPPAHSGRQRGFLTMDQTRKVVLLLESDPKACSLPLVGLWLSGVTHVSSPQVWAWCLRFLFGSALQDRVLSESRCFLLVLFAATHTAPLFFQCRGPEPGPGPQLDYQLLTASQSVTLYQVVPAEGQAVQCELGSEDHSRQVEVFRAAQASFSRAPPAAGLSCSDQDSGVEDLSPRPSPSPHPPAQQTCRVQPSVPELSLLIDSSFTSNQSARQDPGPAPRPPPRHPHPPSSSSALRPAAHLHSTPNSNLQPCTCCPAHTYDCTSIFSSPRLHPPPPSSHHHTPPPSSHHTPPSSHHTPPPPSSHHHTSPPPSSSHHHTSPPPPSSHHHTSPPPPSSHHTPPPPSSHHTPPPPSSHHTPPPPSSHHTPPPPSSHHTPPPPSSHHTSPPPSSHHTPPPSSHHTSPPPSPAPPPWFSRPPPCGPQVGGGAPCDPYHHLLLQQDRQLRLLQAQVQMLLEAQRKLHTSSQQVDTPPPPRSTASIAVGTGASLFWGGPVQPPPQQEVQAPPPSSSPSPSSCRRPPPADLSVIRPVGGAEDSDITAQEAPPSPPGHHSLGGRQSPVLGESASLCGAADDQRSFYQNLMSQLTSRLQEEEPVAAEEESRSSSPSPPGGRQRGGGDPVAGATLRRLQQLGVDVDLMESDSSVQQTVESSSTLATISPAAVLSRLGVSESSSSVLQGGVDLSLEANAIALRYLSDAQLSRLSLGGPAPSSGDSLLSPSNMSLATKKYMRRYGLIEEEEEEQEEQPATRPPLSVKLLPQSQLIRDLRPKMQLLAGGADKENRPRASSRPEASVGNILDLSRLRQLPKLF